MALQAHRPFFDRSRDGLQITQEFLAFSAVSLWFEDQYWKRRF
jgi:hypothetical protein